MKLIYAPTSPFVRKVMAVALEVGLAGKLEIEFNPASPLQRDPALVDYNPLGKIPALVLDDGSVLFDSPVICEYLAASVGDTALFPAAGPARWAALTQQALGDGLLDAAIANRYETVVRPEATRWPGWTTAQLAKITGALDRIEALAPELQDAVTIGTITLGCALGYLDFRYAHLNWREGRPQAAAWFAAFDERPSMAATRPREHVA
ncbi:glutathione S-transferase N-terminal domain-containing protein [Ancylobacter sp. Lp-2]|uniref:glutathione S-transferase N-terminal domain-containing protein n=1 Tax=Ancylobacter sp. Lp-2 TaxID=2881339 RepID=UPI001E4E4017|nr:glutathione S-transferase N-terminal domain-containing protein [Ancylobacter sp. Lp-2]